MVNILYSNLSRFIPVLALLAAISGCESGSSQSGNRPGGKGAPPLPVEAVVVTPTQLENKIYATGTLLANEEVELRPEISGRVTGVYFEEGIRLNKGELMLKINDRELKAQLARIELEEKLASDEEGRKNSLFEMHGISREEYDKALTALKMKQAEKEVIQSQIAETEIFAPFDGVVGLRYISEGGYVTPNMLVATMQDIDPIKAEFSVPEKYARQLKTNLAVTLYVGDQKEAYSGTVYAVESKIDPGTRTMKARATLPNRDGRLIPGSFAKVEIVLENIKDALVIPAQAIIPEAAGQKSYLCVNGKAKSVPVITGIRGDRGIQIISGLVTGDTLIITGLLQLTEGRSVQITKMQSP